MGAMSFDRVSPLKPMVIETTRVARRFGKRLALAGIDLELREGSILALVGPNGSGKTTLLRLLAGFLRPTAGSVRLFGLDPYRRRPSVMAHARFAFAPPALYDNLTARETLTALCRIGDGDSPSNADIHGALETVGLSDRANDRVRAFSFGMRQRLALALTLLPRPRLLVLDEPTDGLDPLAVLELRAILRRIRDEHGVTILLSSHLLTEVEELVDELLLLNEGHALFHGAPLDLLEGRRCLSLVFEGNRNPSTRAAEALRHAGKTPTIVDANRLTLPLGSIDLVGATSLLSGADVALCAFHEQRPTLEAAVRERVRLARNGQSVSDSPSSERRSTS